MGRSARHPIVDQCTGHSIWFADDVDDVLSSGQVINYVENQSNLNLANSTTVGGNSIVTSATTLQPNWEQHPKQTGRILR